MTEPYNEDWRRGGRGGWGGGGGGMISAITPPPPPSHTQYHCLFPDSEQRSRMIIMSAFDKSTVAAVIGNVCSHHPDHLVGLVVRASSRPEDPGLE